jgi:group I intron endonuclease
MRAQCISGIYAIVHVASGRRYVGSAVSIEDRWSDHRCKLALRRHENAYLTAAWHKYGADAFEFVILEPVLFLEFLVEREQHWMDRYRVADRRYGFNIAPKAGSSLGVKHTEEQRAALSARLKGHRYHTPESRAKISAAHMGKSAGRATFGIEHRSLTVEQAATVKTLLAIGTSASKIARDLAIPHHTTIRIALGLTYRDVRPDLNVAIQANRMSGKVRDQRVNAKIRSADIATIMHRVRRGDRTCDIARDHGVTSPLISQIKRRYSHC